MYRKRTDLALEARELWRESAGETTRLPGIRAREHQSRGIRTTIVEVLNQEGVRALRKPEGIYVTLELAPGLLRQPSGFGRAAMRLGREAARLLPEKGSVLVVGLGNGAVTPDAIGPRCLEHLVITRHLGERLPQLRPVSAMAPGVLGTTGIESAEAVRGLVEKTDPACVVVVDALASRSVDRLCTAIQLTDTGITPGSGVGNRRAAFDRRTLGVPVVAVGVPTVVQAATLLADTLEENGCPQNKHTISCGPELIVTSKDVDAQVETMARLLGYGLSLGLHRGLGLEEIGCLIG